jgi:hypothetical protein
MLTETAIGNPRLDRWRQVRAFAVPPTMIETATARRLSGDWAGACAGAAFDVDFRLSAVRRSRGRGFEARLRDDLRHMAPDLLRWHMPRTVGDGLLRPGLTIALARYADDDGPVSLVARTPPAWAGAGQRISLALWDGTPSGPSHPHPHPHRRFRLDLHRHLWDVRQAGELRFRSGADTLLGGDPPGMPGELPDAQAIGRWPDEARILRAAAGLEPGPVAVRLGSRCRMIVHPVGDGLAEPRIAAARLDAAALALPVLPDAATWVPPDVELLRAGLVDADDLHPLVAAALVPDHTPADRTASVPQPGAPVVLDCNGARHRIGLVDGVLTALDHDPDTIRREELLAALGGPPLPCLRAIDTAHRRPDRLAEVRARLDHGDVAGALVVVETLLGPEAVLRDGPLRDALQAAVDGRVAYGLYRSGLLPRGRRNPHHVAGHGGPRRIRRNRTRATSPTYSRS